MKKLLTLLGLVGVCASSGFAAVKSAPPNILLILADDVGWSDLGCYGGEIATPNLDALAGGGVKFTQFYNSARCCPSRASLLTGLYPHQAGVGSMTSDRGPEFPGYRGTLVASSVTLAEVLKSAGYATYMVGKWHLHNKQQDIKPTDRGFDEFYGMLGGYNSCWDEQPYYTRWPKGRTPRAYTSAKNGQPGTFYSTDAFADYSLDFMADARQKQKPFFLYLAFNAAHFPLHAPEADIAKYEAMYFAKGWDVIREERLAKLKQLGLVPQDLALPPRSIIPAKSHAIPSPYAGKENPAWNSLPEDRRRDLARRMAVYAAMVDRMDQAIGRVTADLKKNGQFDNTLILFLSDNGACWEWDPLGFDEHSGPKNILHTGSDLKKVGGPDSYVSYGSAWANAGNTPWRLYKHFDYEGGIRTPFIAHWPAGLKAAGQLRAQPGHIVDVMPTLVAVSGAQYPEQRNGVAVQPMEGRSLLPAFEDKPIVRSAPLFFEHESSRAVRDGKWKLVSLAGGAWELYDMDADPTEMKNLIASEPERAKQMIAAWEAWAKRCRVDTEEEKPRRAKNKETPKNAEAESPATPQIANLPLTIRCEVKPESRNGVILAHGGNQHGYALHLADGRLVFSVRVNGQLATVAAEAPGGRFAIEARLEADGAMTLAINGRNVAQGRAAGLIPVQPVDGLSIGQDARTAVGNYVAPYPLKGTVDKVDIQSRPLPKPAAAADRWSEEKVNAWYAQQPWLVGGNYLPSSAINQLEMWQADTFDPAAIDRELGWAAGIGMNTMRVFLHDIPWREDAAGFCQRIDRYLEIADKHGIKTLFVIFDGVWHPYPKAGKQPAPKPGLHNSGWVQSPGREILENPARHGELKPYVTGILTRYKNDRRVLGWDLFNEPDNPNLQAYGRDGSNIELSEADKAKFATMLVEKTFAWAREVKPSQPITVGVWLGDYLGHPTPLQQLSLAASDVISYHNYDGPEVMLQKIEGLKKFGRPLICTEYMARGNNSTFAGILPLLKEHHVAAYNWGLVDGKSQTIYPWDSWKKPYDREPETWFHDVFRRDGTHYRTEETDLIKRLTGR